MWARPPHTIRKGDRQGLGEGQRGAAVECVQSFRFARRELCIKRVMEMDGGDGYTTM